MNSLSRLLRRLWIRLHIALCESELTSTEEMLLQDRTLLLTLPGLIQGHEVHIRALRDRRARLLDARDALRAGHDARPCTDDIPTVIDDY